MACKNYRIIQLTNNSIGAVANGATMPLGTVTRRIAGNNNSIPAPFEVTTSGADTVNITRKGYYTVTYNATLVATAAGTLGVTLLAGGTEVAQASATAALGDTVNLTLQYVVRVFANCSSLPTNCPLPIQISLADGAVTSGSSNLIIDSCVNG